MPHNQDHFIISHLPELLPRTIHGETNCCRPEEERYWCIVCWTLACWCKGAADEVEELIQQYYAVRVPTGDSGICDDCSATLSRSGELKARDPSEDTYLIQDP